jgi:hypothetical protein
VFEPFVQGGGSQQGLGLGLAVARQLVELHRGQIRVESPGPGAGSTFIVSLPTATAQRAPASAAPLGRDSTRCSGRPGQCAHRESRSGQSGRVRGGAAHGAL